MQYYPGGVGVSLLEGCGKRWVLEESQSDGSFRLRLIGCGQREICPVCGTYVNDALGYDAFDLIAGVIEAPTVAEGEGRAPPKGRLSCFGIKLEFTLPESLSYELDRLLWDKVDEWVEKVNALFRGIYQVVRRFYSDDGGEVAGVVALHLSGESSPWEPHYHFPVYVLPWLMRWDMSWLSVKRWQKLEVLEEMRSSWREVVEKVFGVKVAVVDIKVGFVKEGAWGKLLHYIRYLFRHPLEDLWKGWRDFKDGKVIYEYRKGKKRVKVEAPGEDVRRAFYRLSLLPRKFKRIRWFGYLSDGKKGAHLTYLGFEKVDVRGEVWLRFGEYELLNLGKVGATFKSVSTGEERWFPIEILCFSPAGVLRKKKVWKPPGKEGIWTNSE